MKHVVLRKHAGTKALIDQIDKLNPWFYPVVIDGVLVCPGLAKDAPSSLRLSQRTLYRKHLIVDAVAERINIEDMKVLDVACNMGYWSYQYAMRGATDIVGVEGRKLFVDQAQLFWQHADKEFEQFVPRPVRHEFIHGDMTTESTMNLIEKRGPFDICLCNGLLYHLEDYLGFLSLLVQVAAPKSIIVDTRVTTGPEKVRAEPHGSFFNSLDTKRATKRAVTPNLERLRQQLQSLGYITYVMQPRFFMPEATSDIDDYVKGNRVTVLGIQF